jgi:hypothetical protein
MIQLVLVFFLHFFFIQVPGGRLIQLVPTHRTCGNLEFPAAAPCRLLFSAGDGISVSFPQVGITHSGTNLREPVHQPVKAKGLSHTCVKVIERTCQSYG